MKLNKYRVIWLLTIILLSLLFVNFQHKILPINAKDSLWLFNLFSYYGVLATLSGLIITILEILNNISTTKKINEEVSKQITEFKNDEKLWTMSSCIALIENIIDAVNNSRYTDAKYLLRDLRRGLHRVEPSLLNLKLPFKIKNGEEIQLEALELYLQAYEKSTVKSDVSLAQKKYFSRAMLRLRSLLETNRNK